MRGVLRGTALALLLILPGASGAGSGTADLLIIPSPGYPGHLRFGCAGPALTGGPAALDGNPAAISPGFAAAGGRWNLGTTEVSASGAFRLSGSLHAGIGARYLGRSGLVERNEEGVETGEYSFSSGMVSAGVSRTLVGSWSGGVSLGVVWEDVGDRGGSGFSASAGILGRPADGLTIGATLRGVGSSPSWNGIHKDMPTEIAAGVRYSFYRFVSVFGGGRLGFNTPDSFCLGLEFEHSGFSMSGGYEHTPDVDESTGIFGGIGYTYRSAEVYSIELAFSQRDLLEWPILAGLSILF
jgi:hypothetical protein